MKKISVVFIGLFLCYCGHTVYGSDRGEIGKTPGKEAYRTSIQVFCTPEVYDLTSRWAGEFEQGNPGVRIDIVNLTGARSEDYSTPGENLYFISGEQAGKINTTAWKVVAGRDAIVPVIHAGNPYMDKLTQQGVSPQELTRFLAEPGNRTWSALLGEGKMALVHYYSVEDEAIHSSVANFVNTRQIPREGIRVPDGKALISAIQQDPYGLGFCRLRDVVDSDHQQLAENIRLLPLDKNGNGKMDYFENIYRDAPDFARGLWIGKYPKALSGTVYSLSAEKPSGETEIAFLSWILTDGQQLLDPVGYKDLASTARQQERVAMLTTVQAKSVLLTKIGEYLGRLNDLSIFVLVILLLIPLVLTYMIVDAVIRIKRQKRAALQQVAADIPSVFNEHSVSVPNGLYFDKTHTWAFMERNGLVRIGIDDFLQHITGPITRIRMKNPGEKVKKGEQILTVIQNGKQLTVYAPVTGTIRSQNESLLTDSSLVNSSPFSEGWVYLIEPEYWVREIQFLTMAEKYKEWLKKEFSRLKDFLAGSDSALELEHALIVLQDGGELKEGLLADLGPEAWEDFQTNFLDKSR